MPPTLEMPVAPAPVSAPTTAPLVVAAPAPPAPTAQPPLVAPAPAQIRIANNQFSNYVITPSDLVFEGTTEVEDYETNSSAENSTSMYITTPWMPANVTGWGYGNYINSGGSVTAKTIRLKVKVRNDWGRLRAVNYKFETTCGTETATSYGNWGVSTTGITWGNDFQCYERSEAEKFRDKIRANLAPNIITKNKQLWGIELSDEELRARSLLLELIGAEAFKRYLRKGFIMVTGRSGTLYKISGGHNRIVSYKKNIEGQLQPYEEFCVVFSAYDLPFTDGVIMRKLLVEHDEFSLRKRSNVYAVGSKDKFPELVRAAG